jgi:tripartite-type tricarboxylate transporter receptor subunit TctC
MQKLGLRGKSLMIVAALAALASVARADSMADFYKSRSISMIIGYSVGGGYDAYARLLAHYIGRHIPGEPSIAPQQMTGAGSLRAANYIFSVAPKDGSVLGTSRAAWELRRFLARPSSTAGNSLGSAA